MEEENRIIKFYNEESEKYSNKRYNEITKTYVQFFFKQRRKIVLKLLKKVIGDNKNLSLLDIACADGILTRDIDNAFSGSFSKLVGTDIAPKMVEVANKLSPDKTRMSFYVKDECPVENYNIVLGLGYLSAKIFEDEMSFLLKRLSPDGYYICTFAAIHSVYARLKLFDKPYLVDYRRYSEYDAMLKKYFEIVESVPYGLFVPKLWAVPIIGRIVQPVVDHIFQSVFSNLFHEKVYLLKKKISDSSKGTITKL